MRMFGLAAVFLALGVLLGGGRTHSAAAQDREVHMPSGCWNGEIVVATSGGEFECVTVREALHLSGCDDGDFLTFRSGGELSCSGPSTSEWGVRALLPECSSGDTLVSEGFGRWKCADAP